MHLDGYCKELGIAFEHQGLQHFKFVKRFHRHESTFMQKKSDDERKARLCKKHGIALICVPTLFTRLPISKLGEFIVKKARELKLPNIHSELADKEIEGIYTPKSSEMLQILNMIAESKGGKCLSTVYMGSKTNLRWRCAKGHEWEACPYDIRTGHWCADCGHRRHTLEEMQKLAEKKGGKCLSTEYGNVWTKLKWRCAEGHEWEVPAHGILKGAWCRICANKRRMTLHGMKKLAKKKIGLVGLNRVNRK